MKYSDLASTEFYQNPYPLYERLRQAGPLVQIAPNTLIAGRYESVRAVLADKKMGKAYMLAVQSRYGESGPRQPAFQMLSRVLLMMNPPTHTRLRALLMKAFNSKQVELMRETIEAVADELVDALPSDKPFDLVSDFAVPMPLRIICRMMDVPLADASMLGAETERFAQALEAAPLNAEQLERANAATQNMAAYFRDVVAARRRRPGTDLISMLMSVNENGDAFTEDEIVSNAILMFAAGHETTANMIGNALIALHRNPEELAKLRAQPELLSDAVTECIRYDGSIQAIQRVALEDTEIAGTPIPRGTIVMLSLGAANRDPAQYKDADRLVIDRSDHPGLPLTFAAGIHYCLGARLAILQVETALSALLRKAPQLQLLNLNELCWHQRNVLHGVTSLIGTR